MSGVEAGWYATLRVPETRSDEAWAIELLERDGVYVHPGYFFDMRGAHLVVSLLTPENTLAGLRLAARLGLAPQAIAGAAVGVLWAGLASLRFPRQG